MCPFGNGIPWNKGLKAKDHPSIAKSLEAAHNALKGKSSWNKGIPCSKETKAKLSLIKSNKRLWKGENNPNYKGKITNGHIVGKEQKQKISKLLMGRNMTWGDKVSKARKGNPRFMGVNHYNWLGGISFLPYSTNWTETLRRSIRERDKYICRICSKPQGDIAHDVHHINYDKLDCNPTNLITLCHSCHTKTNNRRKYWIVYFSTLIM